MFFLGLLFLGKKQDISILNYQYYIKNYTYTSFGDLLHVLINLDIYNMNLFIWCCDCINFIGRCLGFNYQIMNLILFVFGVPLLILNLLIISIFQFFLLKRIKFNNFQD